jgi:protease I
MAEPLRGKRIAALVDNGFEQVELTDPKRALERAGAHVEVVSPQQSRVKGWQHTRWGDELPVDRQLDRADPVDYDGLLLPGGVMNPDRLRMNPKAVEFVRAFVGEGKPIAAICHGPWTLIEAGGVKGRRLTSWPSLQSDLRNAGADWVDQPVVVDRNLVTSRKPDDLPAFDEHAIDLFARAHAATPAR